MGIVEVYLGIDGGGTRTRAVLLDSAGHVLGMGEAGSSNYNHAGVEGAGAAIERAARLALDDAALEREAIVSTFLGLAGVVNQTDRSTMLDEAKRRGLGRLLGIGHDIRIALTGGLLGKPGIALIAGTGSSCYGRDAAGKAVQVGGCGFLADDAGSAAWIGQRALARAVREADGRCVETPLRKEVFDFLGIDRIEDWLHRVHVVGLSREELARLSPRIVRLHREGNEAASGIIHDAAAELANLVATASRRLSMMEPEVVLTGGVATSGAPFQPMLESAIIKGVPGARIRTAALPAHAGAAMEALIQAGIEITETLIENLTRTLENA